MTLAITMTVTRMYEPNPQNYGTDDPEKMLDIDMDSYADDPMLFVDRAMPSDIAWEGAVVER